ARHPCWRLFVISIPNDSLRLLEIQNTLVSAKKQKETDSATARKQTDISWRQFSKPVEIHGEFYINELLRLNGIGANSSVAQ
ncbi:MAG: hypothetical protein AAFQ98_26990, partial [Bacteroidota bacterium]